MNSLKGKTALVTGSTSGIGKGIAKILASQGAKMILCGLEDIPQGTNIARELSNNSSQVTYFQVDLSCPKSIDSLFENINKQVGPVDILVNNAGIQYVASTEEMPREKWDQILAINLTAAFITTQHVLPVMKARNWGRIINIASVHGLVASENKGPYVAAKHGLVGLTKVVALETATQNITCNAICPGWVRTPLVEKQIEALGEREGVSLEEATQFLLKEKQPSLTFASPDDIGHYCAFLCTDAASQITGAALTIDGGWAAR
jgi:3-hydroxybutyrate dehydrogenase